MHFFTYFPNNCNCCNFWNMKHSFPLHISNQLFWPFYFSDMETTFLHLQLSMEDYTGAKDVENVISIANFLVSVFIPTVWNAIYACFIQTCVCVQQALFLCNICVVFKPVLPFGNLQFVHALKNATHDHKYSPLRK